MNSAKTLIEFLKNRLGLCGEDKGDEYVAFCPFHTNVNTPAFGIELQYPFRFNCFSCGQSGSIVSLAMRLLGVSFREARRELASVLLGRFPEATFSEIERINPDDAILWAYAKHAQHPDLREYFARRGIPESYIDLFGIGYCLARKAVVIPLINPFSGVTTGFFFRGVNSGFKHIDGFRGDSVFVSPNYGCADTVVVCEGWADALRVYQYRRLLGIPAASVVALMSSKITPAQKLFLYDFDKIVWAFDNDEAGNIGEGKAMAGVKAQMFRLEYRKKDPAASRVFKLASANKLSRASLPVYLR